MFLIEDKCMVIWNVFKGSNLFSEDRFRTRQIILIFDHF